MYSVRQFGAMIADRGRMDPFVAALERAVKPGSVVADLGAGTGVFALVACKLGARRVYAVEPNDAIHLARRLAADNGYADRIEFFQELSTRVSFEEPADVIVSDLRGVLPFYQGHLEAILDARRRLLRPGGVLIPRRDTLFVAPVDAPEALRDYTEPWLSRPFGLDMRAAAELTCNTWDKASIAPEQLVAPARACGSIDYASFESPHFEGSAAWTVERAATAHGLVAWFDSELDELASFSNAPDGPPLVYGHAFFPWPVASAPLELAVGDRLEARLRVRAMGSDVVVTWSTRLAREGRPDVSFEQSTFFGQPLASPSGLRVRSAQHVPSLGEEGRVAAFALAAMERGEPLGVVASALAERFPERFPTWQDALGHVGALSARYDARDPRARSR